MERTRLQDLVIGVLVAIVGAWAWANTYKMPDTTQTYTFCVTGLFALLGVLLIGQSILRRKVPTEDDAVHIASFVSPMIAFVLILIYALLLDKIGFFVTSAVFMAVMMLFLGYRKLLQMGITIVVMLGFIYLLFVYQLNVALPAGILF